MVRLAAWTWAAAEHEHSEPIGAAGLHPGGE